MTIINTDILVVGAGGAGLRAALSARESAPELKVTVISRGEPGKHGVTATACSDRMAFHVSFPQSGQHLTESWRAHAIDIYAGGCYVSDPNLAELLAKESADAFYRLANLGVAFAMGPGKLPMQFITDGSRAPRACYTGPYTARDIEKALIDAVGQTDIQIIGNLALASLILNPKGEISSALCISDETDEWLTVNAKAVIIATGGPGSIFEHSVFPDRMDASAWWAALRAGATLVNLEFIQFGLSSTETSLACSGSMMRALPMLRNEKGRDLLEDVMKIAPESDPVELLFNKGSSWPVSAESSTHAVDVAVHRAIERGEDVFLDYSRNPDFVDAAYLNKMFPEIVNKWYTDRSILLRANGQPVIPYDRLEKINPQVIYWFREHGIDLKATPVR
ncbi:MAG TPA: FAD-binding protein, partial [Firmicutes bacterium]|nr:FAD-binding protein [Bacillota bacterium]